MGDTAAWVGSIISTAALIVSIVALLKSARAQREALAAQREANDAQRRIVEIEEQREKDRIRVARRAELRAALRRAGNSYRLYLINDGECDARNVAVTLDGKPLAEHPIALHDMTMSSVIGRRSEASCILGIHLGCGPPFDIEITWDDDSQERRSYKSTLTF